MPKAFPLAVIGLSDRACCEMQGPVIPNQCAHWCGNPSFLCRGYGLPRPACELVSPFRRILQHALCFGDEGRHTAARNLIQIYCITYKSASIISHDLLFYTQKSKYYSGNYISVKTPLAWNCRSNNCHAFRLPRKGREKRHINHFINAAEQRLVYGHLLPH